ncbi:ATP-dependent helicase fft2 [Hyphodiscus hymeniophilus]|uniref:DNA helicase n=1 Tax=Hyphodiscus hymeniophilus TaxID=353542 RepID=A0A9P6VM62_9HELO|nr:ATP-dependent helicase fft2 [Hyphodiscus hymeniophilus]
MASNLGRKEAAIPNSPPAAKRQKTNYNHSSNGGSAFAYNSDADSGDDLFEGFNPVIPDTPAAPNNYETQPTQILDRTAHNLPNTSSPPLIFTNNEVQVPASSPLAGKVTESTTSIRKSAQPPPRPLHNGAGQKRPLTMSMAPAGTTYKPPMGIVTISDDEDEVDAISTSNAPVRTGTTLGTANVPTMDWKRSFTIHIEEDGVQIIDSDSSEDDLAQANIRPSTFMSKSAKASFNTSPPSQSINGNSKFQNIVSSAKYNPSSDSMASGYGSARRPMQQPIQRKPERGTPLGQDLKLEDLSDPVVRQKILILRQTFPGTSVLFCRDALMVCKGNTDDAAIILAGGPSPRHSDDIESPQRPISQSFAPRMTEKKSELPQMKRVLNGPVASLQERYSSTQAAQKLNGPATPQPKKKKLMQGRRHPSSPAVPEVSSPQPASLNEEDTDSGVASEIEEADPGTNEQVLDFLNTCSVEALVDLTTTTVHNAKLMVAARPFKNLDEAQGVEDTSKTKGGKRSNRVPIGEKIVGIAIQTFAGYGAIDSLVKKCDELGKPLFEEMKTWGFDTFGAAKGGELDLTSFDEQNVSQRDSGFGSPASTNDDVDDDVKVVSSTRKKGIFLKQPATMAEDFVLKDYQVVGLNWLTMMYRHKLSAILADEMGLGKTAQVIALLTQLAETGHPGPHLVICPGSTLENWCKEIQRFSPGLTIGVYRGSMKERGEIADNILQDRSLYNVIVTTYEMATRAEDNKFMRQLKADVCIYDEGHYLKNFQSNRYKQLIKIPATFKLLLTGTPLQNNLQELASLLAFILPEVFKEVEDELAYIFKIKATTRDADHGALLSTQRINRARSMLTPFVLRRKKHQVLKHLPSKTLRVEFCDIHPQQEKIYNSHVDSARERARVRIEGGKMPPKSETDENNPLMQLRKAAVHPLLFRRHFTNEKIEKMVDLLLKNEPVEFPTDKNHRREHLVAEMHTLSDFYLHLWCKKYPCISSFDIRKGSWMNSGKVEAMVKLVKGYKETGDRVLIFSQFSLVLDILEEVLNTSLISFARLDGSTKIDDRQTLVDTFSSDDTITAFLLTTKAGGTGINLMAANKVIIFDGSFNPHDDKQAEDRAHRVGQTRDVEVVRLVMRNTIEEQIFALGISKLALDGRVAGDDSEGQNNVARMLLEGTKLSEEDTKTVIQGDSIEKKGGGGNSEAAGPKKDSPIPTRKRSSMLDSITKTRDTTKEKDAAIVEVDDEGNELLL